MKNLPKTIVITGAAKGIGNAIATALTEQGANLILIDIDPIELHSLNISTYQADLTKHNEIKDLAKVLQENHPKIDVLINNAGIGIYKDIENLSLEEWELALNLNVTAPFLLSKLLLPAIKKSSNPLIINMGSGCGKVGIANRTSYCTTKFGLRGLSLSLFEELKPNIPVIYLALGSVATEFGPLSAEEKLKCPNKKYLSTKDVANKVMEIISSSSKDPQNLPPEIEYYPKGYLETLGSYD